jgi:hypothetical protein
MPTLRGGGIGLRGSPARLLDGFALAGESPAARGDLRALTGQLLHMFFTDHFYS